MEEDFHTQLFCEDCGVAVHHDHRYCHNCGSYLATQSVTINVFNNASLRSVFIFYFGYLFICLIIKNTTWFNSYDSIFWVEIILAATTLWFVWTNRKDMFPVIRFNNFKWLILLGVIAIAAAGSAFISYTVTEVNVSFFNADVSYYNAYKIYKFPVFIMIYSIALMPAVFEELAFRGVMYNYVARFLDERLVVAVTAFLFAIMHLSLLSLVWLIPFGFFIGNLRRKYNTIWYGVVFHFVFNLTACLMDLNRQGELSSIFS